MRSFIQGQELSLSPESDLELELTLYLGSEHGLGLDSELCLGPASWLCVWGQSYQWPGGSTGDELGLGSVQRGHRARSVVKVLTACDSGQGSGVGWDKSSVDEQVRAQPVARLGCVRSGPGLSQVPE